MLCGAGKLKKKKEEEFKGTSEGGNKEGEVADVPYHQSFDGLKAQMHRFSDNAKQ